MPLTLNVDPERLRTAYLEAHPFPHCVIDNLFADPDLEKVLDDFPDPGDDQWRRFENPLEKKLGFDYRTPVGQNLQQFLFFLNSAPMLEFLEACTGIDGLIPDPYFGGAGPHQLVQGGFLKIHADFNWHPKLKLDRRLNVLVYLNQNWKEEYGGHLEMWDQDLTECGQRILPIFNRTVIFSTTDTSYHGNPKPLTCPEGWTRKSVSMYYYTNGRPEEERSAPHDTIFKQTPED